MRPVECKVNTKQPESALEVDKLVSAGQTAEDGVGNALPSLFVDTRFRRRVGSNRAEAASECALSHDFESYFVQVLHQVCLERLLARLSRLFRTVHVHVEDIAHWLLEERVQPVNVADRERWRQQFLEVLVNGRSSAGSYVSFLQPLSPPTTSQHLHFAKQPGTLLLARNLRIHDDLGQVLLEQDLLDGPLVRDPDLPGPQTHHRAVLGVRIFDVLPDGTAGEGDLQRRGEEGRVPWTRES